jgi:hypothetical protein
MDRRTLPVKTVGVASQHTARLGFQTSENLGGLPRQYRQKSCNFGPEGEVPESLWSNVPQGVGKVS